MYIFDSAQKKKVLFESIRQGEAKLYVCGPTVYDDAHLGHARSAVAFDLLRRVLIASGYRVCFVKNFTDMRKMMHKLANTPMGKMGMPPGMGMPKGGGAGKFRR